MEGALGSPSEQPATHGHKMLRGSSECPAMPMPAQRDGRGLFLCHSAPSAARTSGISGPPEPRQNTKTGIWGTFMQVLTES